MDLSKSKINLTFFVLILLSVIYVITAFNRGEAQDTQFNQNYGIYQQATSLLSQGQYAQAKPLLNQLLSEQPDSFLLEWNYGVALAGTGDYRDADYYMSQAVTQRPFLVDQQSFDFQYGQVLAYNGDYAKAQKYILYLQKINTDPNNAQYINPLLKEINSKLKAR